jgi:hypothetical protein
MTKPWSIWRSYEDCILYKVESPCRGITLPETTRIGCKYGIVSSLHSWRRTAGMSQMSAKRCLCRFGTWAEQRNSHPRSAASGWNNRIIGSFAPNHQSAMHLCSWRILFCTALRTTRWFVGRSSLPFHGTMNAEYKGLHYISNFVIHLQHAGKSHVAANYSASFSFASASCCDLLQRTQEIRSIEHARRHSLELSCR